MKKLLLLSVMLFVATKGYTSDIRPYVEGKISQSFFNVTYEVEHEGEEFKTHFSDSVLGGSLEIGAKIDHFRVGLEGYYNDKAEDKYAGIVPVSMESKGIFLNAYCDIPLKIKQIKPYVGFGMGYNWLKATTDLSVAGLGKESIKDANWGYNVGFGVGCALSNNVDLTLGYRYEYLGSIKYYDTTIYPTDHKVSLGLRYTF